MNDRFRVLSRLDPDLARRYVVGVNQDNERRLRDGDPLTGFGRFSKRDVDAILDAALDFDAISKKEEEALMIILAAQSQWEPGARDYMIDRIESHLKDFWSSDPIGDEAPVLLRHAQRIDFVSAGVRHQGTGYHYTPTDFQLISGLIVQEDIGAWEVPSDRTYLRLPPGRAGAWGFYDEVTNDIYLVANLSTRDRTASFCHEVTHAIQDFQNLPDTATQAKHTEADAYVVQAFVALAIGVPYAAWPNRPEEVACRGAAALLFTPMRSRGRTWRADFQRAYDDVVDAYIARHGTASSNEVIQMQESRRGQKRESDLLKKMRKSLKRKP